MNLSRSTITGERSHQFSYLPMTIRPDMQNCSPMPAQRFEFRFIDLLTIAAIVLTGCTIRGGSDVRPGPHDGADGGGVVPEIDGGSIWTPDGSVNSCNPGCGPMELCGDNNDGNGLDDDCNGKVDEGCSCTSGATRPCFAGPPDRRNVGACADGIAVCDEFGLWGSCGAGVSPSPEVCNGTDDDCNGITDDLEGCTSAIMCPGNETASPLSTHRLLGDRVYTGAAQSWHWAIECPASVPAELCPTLSSPDTKDTEVYLTASGAYRASVTVTLEDGTTASCAWSVYVRGGGLRVELNWDTMLDTAGGTDVDLHLHRWTRNGVDTNFFESEDDCYYGNCTPRDSVYAWPGHQSSNLENCENAPHGGGEVWRTRGSCGNPRLDVDTNGGNSCDASQTNPNESDFCAPENINIDEPVIGMPYRIMANYFSDRGYSGMTNATVNIYCGGALRGSFGRDPLVFLRNGESFGEANDNWYVADVVFFEGECGLDCIVYPIDLVARGESDPFNPWSGAAVFGPPWSCNYDASAHSCTPR